MLHVPDFRAEERTFAMLLQVGGRSGRGDRPGRVIVQTLDPQARAIAMAARADDERFYREELERREALGYPPSTTLIVVEVSCADAEKALRAADYVAVKLPTYLPDDLILGPGPLRRERSRHAAKVLVKSADIGKTQEAMARFAAHFGPRFAERGVRLIVDVEPQWF